MRFLMILFLLTGINGISLSQTGFRGNPSKHTVRPEVIDDVLYNPGIGITTEYTPERGGGKSWMPDHNDPLFLNYMGRLVRKLGERYDGHPDIDHIDIRSLGHWGKWHFTFVEPRPEVKPEIRKALVDIYPDNFDETTLIMLIGGDDELAYAIENGAGWRADCLGDLGNYSDTWNHMRDSYQQSLDNADANDAWKYAPVCFESCGVMQKWADEEYDVEFIINEALRWHISVFNNKSSPIPPRWWGELEEFIKKMGYRFVINQISLPSTVKAGQNLSIESEWENTGVAPPYRHYRITYKQIPKNRSMSGVIIQDPSNSTDIREWLPGKHMLNLDLEIPSDLQPGRYNLAVALLDPYTEEVAVNLAIEGRDSQGRYNLSDITIENP